MFWNTSLFGIKLYCKNKRRSKFREWVTIYSYEVFIYDSFLPILLDVLVLMIWLWFASHVRLIRQTRAISLILHEIPYTNARIHCTWIWQRMNDNIGPTLRNLWKCVLYLMLSSVPKLTAWSLPRFIEKVATWTI